MKKKVLVPITILLVLFAIAPVMAAPAIKDAYTAEVSLTVIDPSVTWTTNGGIQHVAGLIAEGSFDSGDLGIFGATMWKKLNYTLNTITGKGTMRGIFVLTVDGDTIEGSFRGRITNFSELAGTVVGQGTGAFEGAKTMGTWEGDMGATIENTLDAILLTPRG